MNSIGTHWRDRAEAPGIFPPDRSEIFQITVWVAIDDATPPAAAKARA